MVKTLRIVKVTYNDSMPDYLVTNHQVAKYGHPNVNTWANKSRYGFMASEFCQIIRKMTHNSLI